MLLQKFTCVVTLRSLCIARSILPLRRSLTAGRSASTSFSTRHFSYKNIEMRPLSNNGIVQKAKVRWKLIVGTAILLLLVVGFNIRPKWRDFRDPKHYYTNFWIRVETSPAVSILFTLLLTYLSNVHVPISLRETIYGAYVSFYGCRMEEAAEESLRAYPTFAAFFNRHLREGVRPISNSLLVSPADGTVLHFGKVNNGWIEYVKDEDYQVDEFLGPVNVDTKTGNALFNMVIYLSPADYHAFHSPTNWRMHEKVHFPGRTFSVKPNNILIVPDLLAKNERVVLSGQWRHGYFSMTAVAALNVGNIVIMNEPVKNRKVYASETFDIYDERMQFAPGEKVGEFRLGSTIVLIFEAPESLEFCIEAGDRVRYGQSLTLQPAF